MSQKYGFRMKWLAVTSFEFDFGGTHIVSDPYITECNGTDLTWENVEKCDYIVLSHAHWDHITDIPRLYNKFKPKVLCGEMTALPMARWLNCFPSLVYPMYPDTELDFGNVKVRALYGRHTDLGYTHEALMDRFKANSICQKDPHIMGMQEIGTFEYRNYLFTLPGGTKILLWGNDPTVEQMNLCKALKPDVAILQRAVPMKKLLPKVEFAAAIGCKVVIPHHHDFRAPDDPSVIENFKNEFLKRVPDGTFIAPKHGEWIEL